MLKENGKFVMPFIKHIIDEIVVNDVQRRVIEDEKSIFNKDQLQ